AKSRRKKVLDNFIERKVTVDRTTSPIQSLITKHEKDIDYVKNMDSNLLPPSLKSDNFNFISTVKRKMNIEAGSRAMLSFKGGMPLTGDKQISISSKTEDTVSEGPISTSLASYNSKESSSIKRSQSSENPRNVSGEEDVGSSNVESNKSYVSKSSMNTMETSENHSNRNAEFVPSALHLRFLAELNQLENVQSTEKHVDKLDRIRDLSVVRQDAATMASIIK
ncbi:Centrosomeassociated protein 350like, partial [Caligus rogercresseyi]